MNARARTAVQALGAAPKHDKEMGKEKKTCAQGSSNRSTAADKGGIGKHQSGRERKVALQQDVDKLRKKLRHEENVHRALERAFTRPLGALPRLPPYLSSHTLELLAEVAVLEEEVGRLEEQVINFRQGLYQEAIYLNSSRKTKENGSEQLQYFHKLTSSEVSGIPKSTMTMQRWSLQSDQSDISTAKFSTIGKKSGKKLNSFLIFPEDMMGKENQLNANFSGNLKQSSKKQLSRIQMSAQEVKKTHDKIKCTTVDKGSKMSALDEAALEESSVPNKLSEDILRCLINIFLRINSLSSEEESGTSPSVSGSSEGSKDTDVRDPYGICEEFGKRNIGPYKYFRSIEFSNSSSGSLLLPSSFLTRRLKLLLRKLESVDLAKLTHQHKLAFWLNIYNSCMMNAFLKQGVPGSPEMIIALMPKAVINVGGHLLSAMTIEHFILRLPYHVKHFHVQHPLRGRTKSEEMAMRGTYGLKSPEPLVTFALSCGSWSSPVVRVYTASQVEKELEMAKRDYLQAAVGVLMPNKLAIPKFLDWYLLDFAKDIESLMEWICLQLPNDLRTEAVKCLEMGRSSLIPQTIQVLPYEFRFRYLLAF